MNFVKPNCDSISLAKAYIAQTKQNNLWESSKIHGIDLKAQLF